MIVHLKAASTAVVRWWTIMSDADKRQARQRALSIGACAAVFAFGGPLVAQRFGAQKAQETYLNEAAVLAESIVADVHDVRADLRPGMFNARADAASLPEEAALFSDETNYQLLGALTIRARDSEALHGLVSFTLDDLGPFKGTDKQLDCLARAVYYEARSEDPVGQMAVAEVVMNRVHDPRFPKSICDVVYQGQYRNTGCQFTFTCDGSVRHKPYGGAWDRAKNVALHVMLGLNTPVTNNATHYHTDYVNPYWAPSLVETASIGTHIFYRFPKTTKEWSNARMALAARHEHDESISAFDDVDGLEGVLPPAEVQPDGSLIAVSMDANTPVAIATKAPLPPVDDRPL
jgi:hypothetical protein